METAEHPVRVLVADDQDLVRSGFRLILLTYGDIDVVGDIFAAPGPQACVDAIKLADKGKACSTSCSTTQATC